MKLTVLLPVYNAEKFLRDALDSLLSQTFRGFEILAINDHSTDKSLSILKAYATKDARLKILENSKNLGVTETLNRGLVLIKTDYIARMDADDIAEPTRFEKQIKFLDRHPEVGVCGTWIYIFTKVPKLGFTYKPPTKSDEIKANFLFENCIQHPTVMFRRKVLQKTKLLYPTDFPHVEDYGLWSNLVTKTDFANIPEPLLYYRLHETQVGKVHSQTQINSVKKVHIAFLKNLGIRPSEKDLKIHENICFGVNIPEKANIAAIEAWLTKLVDRNKKTSYCPEGAFAKIIGEKWFASAIMNTNLGPWIWRKYWSSPLSSYYKPTMIQKRQLFLESVLFPFLRPAIIRVKQNDLVSKLLRG